MVGESRVRLERFHRISAYFILGVLLLSAIGVVVTVSIHGWKSTLVSLTNYADEIKAKSLPAAFAAFFLTISAIGILCVPGLSLVEMISGFVFGLWPSFFLNMAAVTFASTVSFLIGRYFIKGLVSDWLRSDPRWLRLLKVIESSGLKFLILFRLLFVPFFVKNYAPSVLHVKFLDFFVALVLVSAPYSLVFSYVGSQAKSLADVMNDSDVITPATPDTRHWSVVEGLAAAVSLLAAVLMALFAYRELKRAVDREEGAEATVLGDETGAVGEGPRRRGVSPVPATQGHHFALLPEEGEGGV